MEKENGNGFRLYEMKETEARLFCCLGSAVCGLSRVQEVEKEMHTSLLFRWGLGWRI